MTLQAAIQTSNAAETVLTNARCVLGDRVIDGSVVLRGDRIARVDEGPCALASAIDCDGDYLLPGLVELHTDNVERHITPRPGVVWPSGPALLAHDAEITAAGITTVFDALRLGELRGDRDNDYIREVMTIVAAIETARERGAFRADHRLHFRCELSCDNTDREFDRFAAHPLLRLVSVMDHTPGQRQFADTSKYRQYYQGKYGLTDAEMDAFMENACQSQARNSVRNRRHIVAGCHARNIPLASHDDATPAHVDEALSDGVAVAEFPTTVAAARLARENGMMVLMGAPNLVRGGSHSGNVSAIELARHGLLDVLSSDYIPMSLIHAAFMLADSDAPCDLAAAVRTVSRAPALGVGLDDRGEIAEGLRADLVRVRRMGDTEVVRTVWVGGERVA
ncbi:MAG: alpha-D-ribose 1-methylphosphonate 5-triphosphate diphosphatase [Pseudomonadota bacterium]|nr:alpha-D-ribose 1-methylphosphonate 5-triphosphate diphosphatase [Pseudomonadota bacterium]